MCSLDYCPEVYARDYGRLDLDWIMKCGGAVNNRNTGYAHAKIEQTCFPEKGVIIKCISHKLFIPYRKPYAVYYGGPGEVCNITWYDAPLFFGAEKLDDLLPPGSTKDPDKALEELAIIAYNEGTTPKYYGETRAYMLPGWDFIPKPRNMFFMETEEEIFFVATARRVYKMGYDEILKYLAYLISIFNIRENLDSVFNNVVREKKIDDSLILK